MINPSHPILHVPNDIAGQIVVQDVGADGALVEQIFSESFFTWLEEVVYSEDWGIKSWEIASETLLWNPLSALQDAWDDEEMLESLEASSLDNISTDQVFEYLKSLEDWHAGGDAPGLHIFPLQIGDELIYLVGALEFWQGGFVPQWIGVTRKIESIDTLWRSTGRRALSEPITPSDADALWACFIRRVKRTT